LHDSLDAVKNVQISQLNELPCKLTVKPVAIVAPTPDQPSGSKSENPMGHQFHQPIEVPIFLSGKYVPPCDSAFLQPTRNTASIPHLDTLIHAM